MRKQRLSYRVIGFVPKMAEIKVLGHGKFRIFLKNKAFRDFMFQTSLDQRLFLIQTHIIPRLKIGNQKPPPSQGSASYIKQSVSRQQAFGQQKFILEMTDSVPHPTDKVFIPQQFNAQNSVQFARQRQQSQDFPELISDKLEMHVINSLPADIDNMSG